MLVLGLTLADQCLLDITEVFDEIDSLDLSEQRQCLSSALLVLALAYRRQTFHANTQGNKLLSSRSLHKCWNALRKMKGTSALAARVTVAAEGATCGELWGDFINEFTVGKAGTHYLGHFKR